MRITHCRIPTFIFPVSSSAQPIYAMPTFHILKPATHTQRFTLHGASIILAALLACLAPPAAKGHDDDKRFLIERNRFAMEQQIETPSALIAPPGMMFHEGRLHEVRNHAGELETAIYSALSSGQWNKLAELTGRYRLLRDHRPALLNMVAALHARHRGDYPLALRHMHKAHAAEQQDVRIQLELARLLFEVFRASPLRRPARIRAHAGRSISDGTGCALGLAGHCGTGHEPQQQYQPSQWPLQLSCPVHG
jgi:hypothetical protein